MVPRRCAPRALATLVALTAVLTLTAGLPGMALAQEAQPLSLQEAIRLAWEQGPDLEEQRRAVREAELAAREAGVAFGPQVGLNAGYDVSEAADGSVTVRLSVAQSLALEPLWGGEPPEAVRKARLALKQAERQLQEARQDAAHSVLEAYLDLLEARATVEQRRLSLERSQALLEQTELRAAQQAASQADLYEARAEVLSARQELAQAELDASRAQTALNRLLGLPLRNRLELQEPEIAPAAGNASEPGTLETTASPSLEALVGRALAQRLDLVEAREDLDEAQTVLAGLKEPFEPTLSLTAAYRGEDGSVALEVPTDTWEASLTGSAQLYASREGESSGGNPQLPRGWSAGLNLALPLLDGGSRQTDREQQALQLERLEAQLQDLEATVAEEVRQAQEAYLLALEALPVRALQLQAAEARLEAEQQRFQAGVITPRELAEAQSAYDTAAAGYTASRLQVLRSAASLQRAAGLPVADSDGAGISLEASLPQEEE